MLADLHRESVDGITWASKAGGTMRRIPEVFDCWFESGSMPYAQNHYPFDASRKQYVEDNLPADFIAEGLDQTRGWFYTLHVLSTALFDRPAFKNVIVNGLILAADGKKMSKRLKNYPDPNEMLDAFGARIVVAHAPILPRSTGSANRTRNAPSDTAAEMTFRRRSDSGNASERRDAPNVMSSSSPLRATSTSERSTNGNSTESSKVPSTSSRRNCNGRRMLSRSNGSSSLHSSSPTTRSASTPTTSQGANCDRSTGTGAKSEQISSRCSACDSRHRSNHGSDTASGSTRFTMTAST